MKVLFIWFIDIGGSSCGWVLIASSILYIQVGKITSLLSSECYIFVIEFLVLLCMSLLDCVPVCILYCMCV